MTQTRHHRPIDLLSEDEWQVTKHGSPPPSVAEQFWRNKWNDAKNAQWYWLVGGGVVGLIWGAIIGALLF